MIQRHVDFNRPPVVETVLGVHFDPIAGWDSVHYGLYWRIIASEYPKHESQPILGSAIEKFGPEADRLLSQTQPQIEFIPPQNVRLFCITERGDRVLQVQPDHFVHNWRRVQPESYPQYDQLRPRFEREWARFLQFLVENGLGTPRVRQCEVTYVNHIERGDGWESTADLGNVAPYLRCSAPSAFLPAPEAIALNVSYQMPREQGRLRVTLNPAVRHVDLKTVLQLTLTARGRPDGGDIAAILRWLDLGREWVVKGFRDFTSPAMHERWGLRGSE